MPLMARPLLLLLLLTVVVTSTTTKVRNPGVSPRGGPCGKDAGYTCKKGLDCFTGGASAKRTVGLCIDPAQDGKLATKHTDFCSVLPSVPRCTDDAFCRPFPGSLLGTCRPARAQTGRTSSSVPSTKAPSHHHAPSTTADLPDPDFKVVVERRDVSRRMRTASVATGCVSGHRGRAQCSKRVVGPALEGEECGGPFTDARQCTNGLICIFEIPTPPEATGKCQRPPAQLFAKEGEECGESFFLANACATGLVCFYDEFGPPSVFGKCIREATPAPKLHA